MQQRRVSGIAGFDARDGVETAQGAAAFAWKHGLIIVARKEHVGFFVRADGVIIHMKPPAICQQME